MLDVSWLCCNSKKFVFRGSRTLEVAWWPNGSRRLRRSHRTLMRWFWNMWETLSSQKEFKCEVDLCQHIANRVGEVFSLGKKSGKQQLQNPLCCRWRRKRDVLSCKLVRYCNTKLVLIRTRNREAPELKAETSSCRPRFWDLGACLVWGTHWNYQLWKMDALTGNVFPSLRRHSVNLLFIKVWCK